MFLSGDIRSSRDGCQKRALPGRPLCLRATLIFAELLYLAQVFPPVCRGKTRSFNTKYKLSARGWHLLEETQDDFCHVFWTLKSSFLEYER